MKMMLSDFLKSGVWKKLRYWRVEFITNRLEEGSMDKSYDLTVSEVIIVNKSGQEW